MKTGRDALHLWNPSGCPLMRECGAWRACGDDACRADVMDRHCRTGPATAVSDSERACESGDALSFREWDGEACRLREPVCAIRDVFLRDECATIDATCAQALAGLAEPWKRLASTDLRRSAARAERADLEREKTDVDRRAAQAADAVQNISPDAMGLHRAEQRALAHQLEWSDAVRRALPTEADRERFDRDVVRAVRRRMRETQRGLGQHMRNVEEATEEVRELCRGREGAATCEYSEWILQQARELEDAHQWSAGTGGVRECQAPDWCVTLRVDGKVREARCLRQLPACADWERLGAFGDRYEALMRHVSNNRAVDAGGWMIEQASDTGAQVCWDVREPQLAQACVRIPEAKRATVERELRTGALRTVRPLVRSAADMDKLCGIDAELAKTGACP